MSIDMEVNRRLRMWRYSVSHSELVLMSTNDVGEYPTRFYVLLKPVSFVSLPNDFEYERIRSSVSQQPTRFEFLSGDAIHYVVADYFFHGEDHELWNAPIPFGIDTIIGHRPRAADDDSA